MKKVIKLLEENEGILGANYHQFTTPLKKLQDNNNQALALLREPKCQTCGGSGDLRRPGTHAAVPIPCPKGCPPKEDVAKLRKKLAELSHEQWSGWIKYMFDKCQETCPEDGKLFHEEVLVIPEWAVKRWTRQANTPYNELSHKEKESDRTEADKFIAIIESMEANDNKS